MNNQFNKNRLDLARRRRGMTQRALAMDANLSRKSLARYLNGERDPDEKTVGKFAKALDFPAQFFYRNSLDEIASTGPSFRAMSNLTVRKRDQAIAAGILGVAISDWIDERFQLPPVTIPRYEVADPEVAAMGIRTEWGLGEQSIPNMVHLLELHGVRVYSLPEDTREVDACSFWRNDTPFIFLNTSKSAERGRMDAAHELGHLALHSKGGSQLSRLAEQEAQQFASVFLMPTGSILSRVKPSMTLPQILQAKLHWKVSAANLTFRMYRLGLLSKYHYTRLFTELSTRGYRSNEPDGTTRETSQVLEKVFRQLHARGVSVARVASELSIPQKDFGGLLFGLVKFPLVI